MKVTIFDRKKYMEAVSSLLKRGAPNYVIEAYKAGYAGAVNLYYQQKLERKTDNKSFQESRRFKEIAQTLDSLLPKVMHLPFIQEAKKHRDEDFLKAFFVMTNMDILSGGKLPPKAGRLLKDSGMYNIGFSNVYKKDTRRK